jgi:hypothetical protein
MWGPSKPGGIGFAAGLGLGTSCLCQRRDPRAEAGVWRRHAVRLERLAPTRLGGAESRLCSLVTCVGHLFAGLR